MLTYQPGCPNVADVPDSVAYGGAFTENFGVNYHDIL